MHRSTPLPSLPSRSRTRRRGAATLALLVVLAACGDSNTGDTASTSTVEAADTTAARSGLYAMVVGYDGVTPLDDCPLGDLEVITQVLTPIVDMSVFDGASVSYNGAREMQNFKGAIGCSTGDLNGPSGTDLGLTVLGGGTAEFLALMDGSHKSATWGVPEVEQFAGGRLTSMCVEGSDTEMPECVSWWEADGLMVVVNLRVGGTTAGATKAALETVLPSVLATLSAKG
ncbi:MAG: hypothetical protein ABMA25_02455 [Ilumatobacteraceae bacterium]